MAFILTCIIILASVPALADTVTGHTDGAPIAAPIAIGEVERAALGSAGTKQGPRMKAALNRPSSNTDASPASRAKVWQVGAKRQLRYPSDAAKVANSSRLIDLPNCGMSLVLGNDLHQAATTENSNAIGFRQCCTGFVFDPNSRVCTTYRYAGEAEAGSVGYGVTQGGCEKNCLKAKLIAVLQKVAPAAPPVSSLRASAMRAGQAGRAGPTRPRARSPIWFAHSHRNISLTRILCLPLSRRSPTSTRTSLQRDAKLRRKDHPPDWRGRFLSKRFRGSGGSGFRG